MTTWILAALALLPLAAAAGSLLHAAAFMLCVAGFANVAHTARRKPVPGFPGRPARRHAKLAVPALAVLAVDVALLWLATNGSAA